MIDAVERLLNPPRWWTPARFLLATLLLVGIGFGSTWCLAAVLGWLLLPVVYVKGGE